MKIQAAFVGLTKRVKSGVSSCRGFRATAGPRTNCSFDGCCGLPQRDRSQREKRASFLFILLQHIYIYKWDIFYVNYCTIFCNLCISDYMSCFCFFLFVVNSNLTIWSPSWSEISIPLPSSELSHIYPLLLPHELESMFFPALVFGGKLFGEFSLECNPFTFKNPKVSNQKNGPWYVVV